MTNMDKKTIFYFGIFLPQRWRDIDSCDGSIPGFYNIRRYLNLVRFSIFDTFNVKLPNTFLAYSCRFLDII